MGSFFLFVCSKLKRITKTSCLGVFLSIFWVVLNEQIFFSWSQRSGLFIWKLVAKWTIGTCPFCRYNFSEEWSEKKNGFLYPQNECDHLLLSCFVTKVKRKVKFEKSCFFPQHPFFQEPPSNFFSIFFFDFLFWFYLKFYILKSHNLYLFYIWIYYNLNMTYNLFFPRKKRKIENFEYFCAFCVHTQKFFMRQLFDVMLFSKNFFMVFWHVLGI